MAEGSADGVRDGEAVRDGDAVRAGRPAGSDDAGGAITAGTVLTATLRRMANDPRLLAPFVLLGAWVGVVDALRRADPVPTASGPWLADGHVSLHLPVYPGGIARTGVPPESVVGLRPGYLALETALAGSVLVGTGLAIAVVVALASARLDRVRWSAAPRLAGYVVALATLRWLVAALAALREEFALVALLVGLALSVRLFAAPSLLAHGATYRTAVVGSNRLVRDHDWSVLGVGLLGGLAAYALASAPVAGGALSTALVGPALAVASLVVHRALVGHSSA